MNEIHPLVMATMENERARRELELERLRAAREACVTSSAGGQNRAMALGKKIRQLEKITGSWRLVLATVMDEMDEMTGAAEDADRVVGSVTLINKRLRCLRCTKIIAENLPRATLRDVTPKDLPDGGMCADCGADLLDGWARAAKQETEAPRVVGSKASSSGALRCVNCTSQARKDQPKQARLMVDVTSEDLPDGGMCNGCGADVMDEDEQPPLVAYRSKINGLILCREHGEGTRFTEGLSSEDLPNGGFCSQCHGDVMA